MGHSIANNLKLVDVREHFKKEIEENSPGAWRLYLNMRVPEKEDIIKYENGILYVWKPYVPHLIGSRGINIKQMKKCWDTKLRRIVGCEKVVKKEVLKCEKGGGIFANVKQFWLEKTIQYITDTGKVVKTWIERYDRDKGCLLRSKDIPDYMKKKIENEELGIIGTFNL